MQQHSFIGLAAIVAAVGFTGPTFAADWQLEVRQARVSYADLSLTRESGARTMLQRIERAAKRVCNGAAGRVGLAEISEAATCRIQTVAEAVSRLDAPQVTALHTGSTPPTQLARR